MKVEITINVNAPCTLTDEQAEQVARRMCLGVQQQANCSVDRLVTSRINEHGEETRTWHMLDTLPKLSREQALELGRQIQRGMQMAMVRSYVPSQRDLDLTRPRLSSIPPWPFPTSEPKACFECTLPETCKRIDVCVAHKCRFGEDDAP